MRLAPRIRLVGSLGLLSAATILGEVDSSETALFDSAHAPEVLVETRLLAAPPRLEPNRLVRGWTPWRSGDGALRLIPGDGARLQIVDLEARPRRLVFDGRKLVTGQAWAEVTIGEVTTRVALEDRFSIDLPVAAELGRRIVDLELERPGTWALSTVAVTPASVGGGADCDAGGCRQRGPSIVEAVRRMAPGTVFSGVFVPPSRPGPDQRFEVAARTEDGRERILFRWRADGRRRVVGRRPFEVEVAPGGDARWVRLQLRAFGGGSPAVWRHLRLRAPDRRSPPAVAVPAAPPRLVVVYVMDAWRADHVSHLGGERGLTPVVDRLAAAGATFRRHASVAPNTMPATKALFTGRHYFTHGGRALGRQPATLAEAFAAAGYRTALFSGNGHASPRQGTARGFEHVEESVVMGGAAYVRGGPGYNDNAERVHDAALAWLRGLAGPDPAFVYLHTIHPHTPYDPPAALAERFTRGIDAQIDGRSRTLRDIGQGRRTPTAAERRRLARLYAASVAYADRELETFLRGIGERFRPEEVLFVLTSDHGEELFDHGGVLHGYTLYDEALRVPLIVRWPGVVGRREIAAPSDTVDVHDGLRALVDAEAAKRRPGFWRQLAGRAPAGPVELEPEVRFAAASSVPGGIFAARTERWKVIWAPQTGAAWGMGGGGGRSHDWEYVFDRAQGSEKTNRAGSPDPEVDWLRSRLLAWVEAGLRAESGGTDAPLDDEGRRRLRALGYID